MIKSIYLSIFLAIFLTSCGSSKKITSNTSKNKTNHRSAKFNNKFSKNLADKVVWTAVTYKGVPYKYGGVTKRGMDCSGLIHTSFKKRGLDIPRTSNALYQESSPIKLRNIRRGDLLFFKTSKKRKQKVNHVGLVVSVKKNNVKFIHSTVSKGVVVTSLNSPYWRKAYVASRRILK